MAVAQLVASPGGDARIQETTGLTYAEYARSGFFQGIARRLAPGAMLASSDLASDVQSPAYEVLLRAWMSLMAAADIPADA